MRSKIIDGQRIELTAEENTARDQEEQLWADGAFSRALDGLREKRNRFLAESDFYALSDVEMSAEVEQYRQDLRDLPAGLETVEDVDSVVWPQLPN